MQRKHLIVIVGPTAVGKTACCITLAQYWKTEIISADSRQFYQEMSIGTAKPTPEEIEAVPHHLVDFLPLTAPYSAGMFEMDALRKLEELWQCHDVVLLTGGSGLYIQAVCEGIVQTPPVPFTIQEALLRQYKTQGVESLCQDLATHDPDYYATVDHANPHRLIRALGVCLATGKPYSYFRSQKKTTRPFNIIKVGLNRPRSALYTRIEQRVDRMVETGLLQEAKVIYDQGYPKKPVIGYQELFNHFAGLYTLEEAIAQIKKNTRNYAKRQMTWFRKDKNITWFAPDNLSPIRTHIAEALKKAR